MGEVLTAQAFSKGTIGGKEVTFRTVVCLVPPDDYTRTLGISQPFLTFGIYVEPLGTGNHLELQNPILSATLNKLREEKDKGTKSDYSLENFEEEVFTKLNP